MPKQRTLGMTHEVASFDSVNASVASYIHHLNTGQAYAHLRDIRSEFRNKGEIPNAHTLAAGLIKYSERGQDYVDELRRMMRINNKLMGQ